MGKTITTRAPITSVNGITVNTNYIQTTNCTVASSRAVKYIVMHYTGNSKDTAVANAKYFCNNKLSSSAHYFVDDSTIYQSVALKDRAWHCGASTYYHDECRNANSIGIEMCCTAGNYKVSDTTIENAAYLAAAVAEYLGISADEVDTYIVRHYDVTHKDCPSQWVTDSSGFTAFKTKVKAILSGTAAGSEELTMAQYDELNERVSALENKMIYNYIDTNMPEWARPTVQKLVGAGILQGDENGELGLTDEMLRMLVVLDRTGIFG